MTEYAFTSARLAMRPWRLTDLESFHAIFGDERVIWWGTHKRDLAESRDGLARAIAEQNQPAAGLGRFAVEVLGTSVVVGNVILRPASFAEDIEVGYHFAFDAWGCGYATEAARATLDHGFTAIRLERVVAAVALQNARSLRLMEKLGMVPTYEREHGGLPHRMCLIACSHAAAPNGAASHLGSSGSQALENRSA
jgi:[ribosomal protein S5]-alanine N-acetyltransferase